MTAAFIFMAVTVFVMIYSTGKGGARFTQLLAVAMGVLAAILYLAEEYINR